MTALDEDVEGGPTLSASGSEPPEPSGVADGTTGGSSEEVRNHGWPTLVVGAGAYLVLAVALWWNVWSTHPTSTTTCGCGDTSLFTWFLEWPGYALSHGLDPFYSTYMFHPTGINLLANTAVTGIGLVLAPVTWLFGPIATVNVAVTLSPFLSALAMYVLLRRWVSWSPAAFVGGFLYGFSPFIVIELTDAHLMVGMAPVPPLLVLCLDELLVRQRWRPWATGVAIAGLAFVQFFIGSEVLVLTALMAAIGVAFLIAWTAIARRGLLASKGPYALRAAGVAVVGSVILLAYPVWFALAGPAHLSGAIWGKSLVSFAGTTLGLFVHTQVPAAGHTGFGVIGGYQAPIRSDQFFGIGLVVVLGIGLVLWWRDLRLWLFAALGVLAVFLSLGFSFYNWTLWRLALHLPELENVVPSRIVLFGYLCAAVMLGIVCDHVYNAVSSRLPGRAAGPVAGVIVAALALVPIVSYFAPGLPLTATPVRPPDWFQTVAPRLSGHQVLLVFPFSFIESNLTWQAVDGMSYEMAGGAGPEAIDSRAGKETAGFVYLSHQSFGPGTLPVTPADVTSVRAAVDGWGVTGVVLPDPRTLPFYDRVRTVRTIVVLMTAVTGQAPRYVDRAWVWSGVDTAGTPVEASITRLQVCAAGPAFGSVASIHASASCVLAARSP